MVWSSCVEKVTACRIIYAKVALAVRVFTDSTVASVVLESVQITQLIPGEVAPVYRTVERTPRSSDTVEEVHCSSRND